jgi:alpha-D-xyloside xylohydrolase
VGFASAGALPAMRAAPVSEIAESESSISTYLPDGADWFDFWTNQRHQGGRTVSRSYTFSTFPLYVRAGSILPMSPVMNYVTEKLDAPYEIRVYPGADARFTC